MEELVLDGWPLAITDVVSVARGQRAVRLGADAARRLETRRQLIDRIVDGEAAVYGVNTGFGQLSCVRIPPGETRQLQLNLVRSHAAGAGEPLPVEVVRAMLLLSAASLARGYSGVRPQVPQTLCTLLNAGIHPLIPRSGSVGASGDLAPLAHMALALLGEGTVLAGLEERSAREALLEADIAPLELKAKEGLALLNGTHLMAGSGALTLHDAEVLLETAIGAAAMSLEGARGSVVPYDARIHALRPHPGQVAVAARLRELLDGSEIVASHHDCPRVQDPYSLRCVPQVLGTVKDALAYVRGVLETELGSVTDNPLCFAGDETVISGGNFHGQPLALALDMLAVAVTHLAAMAERRIFLLLAASEQEMQLPPFLSHHPGIQSGLMIAQYTAAALVNECQVLAHPASTSNIPTSAGMEDFNSMGATAADKARRVVHNARRVVAIELLCAAQALAFHRPLRAGSGVERIYERVRQNVPAFEEDRPSQPDIATLERVITGGALM